LITLIYTTLKIKDQAKTTSIHELNAQQCVDHSELTTNSSIIRPFSVLNLPSTFGNQSSLMTLTMNISSLCARKRWRELTFCNNKLNVTGKINLDYLNSAGDWATISIKYQIFTP